MRFWNLLFRDNPNDTAVAGSTERKEEQKLRLLGYQFAEAFRPLLKGSGNYAQEITELRVFMCRLSVSEATRSLDFDNVSYSGPLSLGDWHNALEPPNAQAQPPFCCSEAKAKRSAGATGWGGLEEF